MGKLSIFLIYALTVMAPALATCADLQSADEQSLYAEAQKAMDNYPGDQDGLEKADNMLNIIYRNNPQSALAQTGLGRLAYLKGYINRTNYEQSSLNEAHSHFAKALSINPNLFDAWIYGANPYIYEKNYAQAKKYVRKAEGIRPSSPKVDLLYATIAKNENNIGEVERRSQRVINNTSDPKSLGDAYSLMTWVYQRQKRYDLADKTYLRIIELNPNSAWSKINYSQYLILHKRYDEAIDYGKRALEIMDFGMGHYALSQALCGKGVDLYWKEKRPAEAKNYFEAAVQHDPDNASAFYGLGMSYYSTGHQNKNVEEIEKAEKALRRAIQLNPNLQQAKVALNRLELLLRAVKK